MLYLTYNDQPSGVFSSQVIDTGNFLNAAEIASIRLVAFISVRGFSAKTCRIVRTSGTLGHRGTLGTVASLRHANIPPCLTLAMAFLPGSMPFP